MKTFSEFLPLIFIAAFVILSIRRGRNQKRQEEMTKTTLPGRKSGEMVYVPESVPERPVHKKPVQKATPKPEQQKLRASSGASSHREESRTEFPEDISEPLFNLEEVDDVKKAVIYTEILNRKAY
ncbi:MAG: hypothetical protein LBB64_01260 [Dysgonamonadaceae bacterium]|jgi:hypothetical protein|nr:hypothetical protein [Dysgonamonadaceae bacterium]